MKPSKLITLCIATSVGLHLAALVFFYRNPLILYPTNALLHDKLNRSTEDLAADWNEMSIEEKNRTLEEVFSQLTVVSPNVTKPYDSERTLFDLLNEPLQEEAVTEIAITAPRLKDEAAPYFRLTAPELNLDATDNADLQVEEELPSVVPVIEFVKKGNVDYSKELALSTPVFEEEQEESMEVATQNYPEALPESTDWGVALYEQVQSDNAPNIKEAMTLSRERLSSFQFETKEQESFPLVFAKPLKVPASEQRNAILSEKIIQDGTYLTSEELAINSWNVDFDVDVQLSPQKNGKGYLFSLKLDPSEDMLECLKQNFYFLIDRSNSVEKHRFNVYKKAVLRALSALQPKDTFNIFIFDKKIARLSEKNLSVNADSLRLAEEFLEKEEYSRLFSATDMYTLLDKIVPSSVPEGDVNTAILITDGGTLMKLKKQRQVLSDWTEKNNGKVSLYTAAVGGDNNLQLLDILSSFNKGKLLYSETHASFPRKLTQFVYDLRKPLAKDMAIWAKCSTPGANILLYPPASRLPNFYSHQPYIIVGTIDKPCDFTLTIQGKHQDQWLNIEKKVSFKNAKKGNSLLEKKWAHQQAHVRYEHFLKEGKVAYLDEAKEILKPHPKLHRK